MGFAEDYKTVPERLAEFFDKYPAGSLQRIGEVEVYQIEGRTFIAYTAGAYRTADDVRPGVGTAWERVPGLTRFTENSEIQNAETSAWGRAIVAVGAADTKKGVASAEDVQNRMAEEQHRADAEAAVGGLRGSIIAAVDKLDDEQKVSVKAWMAEQNLPAVKRMNADQCDLMIAYLMEVDDGAVDVG